MQNPVDFSVATSITTSIQLIALGLLVGVQIVFIIYLYKRKKQEDDQKLQNQQLKQEEESAQRKERLSLTKSYTESINQNTEALKRITEITVSMQSTIDNMNHMIDEKFETLIDGYVGELSETMANELIDLVFKSASDRMILFCNEVLKNNHIKENQEEVNQRIFNYVHQDYGKDLARLQLFKYNGVSLAYGMNPMWQETLIKGTQVRIFQAQSGSELLYRNLYNFVKDSFEQFKMDCRVRLNDYKKM